MVFSSGGLFLLTASSGSFAQQQDFSLHLNLGVAYYHQGEYEKSEQELKEAVRIAPDSFEAHYNLCLTFMAQQEFSLAEEELKSCLSLRPDYPELHFQLGNIYFSPEKIFSGSSGVQKTVKGRSPSYSLFL